MLEQKITELQNSIETLTAAVTRMTAAMNGEDYYREYPADVPMGNESTGDTIIANVPTDALRTDGDEIKAAKTKPEPEPKQVTVDDLRDICMNLVRADRTKKPAIKETIASFDGAKTLNDVPAKDLADLMAKLEAL